MSYFERYNRALRAAVLGMCVFCGACTTWEVARAPLAVEVARGTHEIRVRGPLIGEVRLENPFMEGDSVVSIVGSSRIAIAQQDIAWVEVKKVAVGRTILLAGFTASIIIAAVWPQDDPPPTTYGNNCSPYCTYSCPAIYSWDGERWRLDSATFGGAIMPALARSDIDNLDHVTAESGTVRLRIENNMDETDYIDRFRLLAIDHAPGTTVAPYADGRITTLGPLLEPSSAIDFAGVDVMPRLASADRWSWESTLERRDPGDPTAHRDGIEVVFEHGGGASHAKLVVDAHVTPWAASLMAEFVASHGRELDDWYQSFEKNPEMAEGFSRLMASDAFLRAEVWNGTTWVPGGLIREAGPELPKRQVLDLDLSGLKAGPVRVRLSAPPSFWLVDHVALDVSGTDSPMNIQAIAPNLAEGPAGTDFVAELSERDGSYAVLDTGERIALSFAVVDPPQGSERTYLSDAHGWYRMKIESEGPTDSALLSRIATQPGAIADINLEWLNRSIDAMNAGARR